MNFSAHGQEFQQPFIDYRIYEPNYQYNHDLAITQPEHFGQIQDELAGDRASLFPSSFPTSEFQGFNQGNATASFEGDINSAAFPVPYGDSAAILNQQNVFSTGLDYMTNDGIVKHRPDYMTNDGTVKHKPDYMTNDGTVKHKPDYMTNDGTVKHKPDYMKNNGTAKRKLDYFDGIGLQVLGLGKRKDNRVQSNAIPTQHREVPIAPNPDPEVNGPDGNASLAQGQAYDRGAHGARAKHTSQNPHKAAPTRDGNAYATSSTSHVSKELQPDHTTANPPKKRMTPKEQEEFGLMLLSNLGKIDVPDQFAPIPPPVKLTRELLVSWRLIVDEPDPIDPSRSAPRTLEDAMAKPRKPSIEFDEDVNDANAADSSAKTTTVDSGDKEAQMSKNKNKNKNKNGAWFGANDAFQPHVANFSDNNAAVSQAGDTFGYPQHTSGTQAGHGQAPTDLYQGEPGLSYRSLGSSKAGSSKRPRQSLSPPSTNQKKRHKSTKANTGLEETTALQPIDDASFWAEGLEFNTGVGDGTDEALPEVGLSDYWASVDLEQWL